MENGFIVIIWSPNMDRLQQIRGGIKTTFNSTKVGDIERYGFGYQLKVTASCEPLSKRLVKWTRGKRGQHYVDATRYTLAEWRAKLEHARRKQKEEEVNQSRRKRERKSERKRERKRISTSSFRRRRRGSDRKRRR